MANTCKFLENGLCKSPINKQETVCEKIPVEWCYYKQLKQVKAEKEELKDEIAHLRQEGYKSCAYCKDLIEQKKNFDIVARALNDAEEENEILKFKLEKIKDECIGNGLYTIILEIIESEV